MSKVATNLVGRRVQFAPEHRISPGYRQHTGQTAEIVAVYLDPDRTLTALVQLEDGNLRCVYLPTEAIRIIEEGDEDE